jgi:hypothetical protein
MIVTIIAIIVGFFILSLIVGEPMGKATLDKRSQRKFLQSQGPCTCYDPITKQWDAARSKACETHGTKN